MEKWEYKDVTFDSYQVKGLFEEWLDEYGQQGWELVSVYLSESSIKKCIFKRKIQQG